MVKRRHEPQPDEWDRRRPELAGGVAAARTPIIPVRAGTTKTWRAAGSKTRRGARLFPTCRDWRSVRLRSGIAAPPRGATTPMSLPRTRQFSGAPAPGLPSWCGKSRIVLRLRLESLWRNRRGGGGDAHRDSGGSLSLRIRGEQGSIHPRKALDRSSRHQKLGEWHDCGKIGVPFPLPPTLSPGEKAKRAPSPAKPAAGLAGRASLRPPSWWRRQPRWGAFKPIPAPARVLPPGAGHGERLPHTA
jgi:hypothetical protein